MNDTFRRMTWYLQTFPSPVRLQILNRDGKASLSWRPRGLCFSRSVVTSSLLGRPLPHPRSLQMFFFYFHQSACRNHQLLHQKLSGDHAAGGRTKPYAKIFPLPSLTHGALWKAKMARKAQEKGHRLRASTATFEKKRTGMSRRVTKYDQIRMLLNNPVYGKTKYSLQLVKRI